MKHTWFRAAQAAVVTLLAVGASLATDAIARAQPSVDAGTVTITGDPADPVTGGASRSFGVAGGDWFNLLPTPDFSAFGVHVSSTAGEELHLTFAAPSGRTLTPGTYRAVEYGSHGARAGLSVVADDRACTTSTGRFAVMAASFPTVTWSGSTRRSSSTARVDGRPRAARSTSRTSRCRRWMRRRRRGRSTRRARRTRPAR